MVNRIILLFLAINILVWFPACKNQLDKIKTSGDTELIYKKGMEYYDKEEWADAQSLFELILSNYRGKKESEVLYYKYAYTHYYLQNYLMAAYYFKSAANLFSTGEHKEESEYMAAYSNYRLSPDYKLDQTETLKAIDGFQAFINTFPQSTRVADCNKLIDELRKKLAKKEMAEGTLYYNIRQYQSAISTFSNLLNDYPDITDREYVRFMIVKASYLWAENSIIFKQEERLKITIDRYEEFVNKYPKSKYLKEAKLYYRNSKLKLKEIRS